MKRVNVFLEKLNQPLSHLLSVKLSGANQQKWLKIENPCGTLFGLRVGSRVRDMYIFVINLPNQSIDKLVVQLLI